jgi:hypothetical protein
MDVLDDMPVLVRLADETPELYVVIRPDEYADLQRRVHVRTCVLDRRPLPEPKIGDLITRQPWPELWLAGVNEACR